MISKQSSYIYVFQYNHTMSYNLHVADQVGFLVQNTYI